MDKEILQKIKDKLNVVPQKPGSYQMKNSDGLIIYVGKAKDLKKRLKSYFTGLVTGKTKMLVDEINDFDFIVTSSELESLILEFNLIKKYDPKYNILLKDDKSYPYIEITNEKYPKLQIVRNIKRRKHVKNLFGPYPNVTSARNVVALLNRIYPFRKCNSKKGEICFYYHLNQCMCGLVDEFDANVIPDMVKEASNFLRGNSKDLIAKLSEMMSDASENFDYEKALELKRTIEDINITTQKQKLDLKKKYNADIFGYFIENNYLSITCFFVREGVLFGSENKIVNVISEVEEAVVEYILNFYEKNPLRVKNIIVDSKIDTKLLSEYFNAEVSAYQKGDLSKLQKLATQNAKEVLGTKLELIKINDNKKKDALIELQELLNTKNVSVIEAFDNSHLFGTFYVGGMVVFKDFDPIKNDYRKFKINIDNKDDISAMKEVVYRRYFRVLMEDVKKPDIIVVDGGIQQINAVRNVLEELNLNINLIGLKKDTKHRTNMLLDRHGQVLPVKKDSTLFLYLSRIQEEVHNYAIHYHRQIKTKGTLVSLLDLVPGIGEVKKKELLKKFGSLKKMKEATQAELEDVIDKKTASVLYQYLKEKIDL